MEEIGTNLLLAVFALVIGLASITVTVGRFNMRARFERKPDGTVEVDEAGDQSIGAEADNTQSKVNVVSEKVANPQPTTGLSEKGLP